MSNPLIVAVVNSDLSIGKVCSVSSHNEGLEAIKTLAGEKLGRELTEAETDDLEISLEFFHDGNGNPDDA